MAALAAPSLALPLFLLSAQDLAAQNTLYPVWRYSETVGQTARTLSPMGDLDGDGFADILIGHAWGMGARVLSGLTGRVLLTASPPTGDLPGMSVAGLGDIDGDGKPDFIIGAGGVVRSGLTNCGAAKVYSGRTGTILYAYTGVAARDYFGGWRGSVGSAGDIDRDGRNDFAVGAPVDGASHPGYVNLYSGRTGQLLRTLTATQLGGSFGQAVGSVGDVDNDGIPDLAVGEPWLGAGRVHVFSGATGALVFTSSGNTVGDWYGFSIAAAGDINGDGRGDTIVGAYQSVIGGQNRGYVRVVSGNGGTIIHTFTGPIPEGHLGQTVSGGADLDLDGVTDIVSGSDPNSAGNVTPGFIMVHSGRTGGLIGYLEGEGSDGWGFGRAVAALGNTDPDSNPDIAVYGNQGVGGIVYNVSIVPPTTVRLAAPAAIGTTVPVPISSPGDPGLLFVAALSLGDTPGIPLADLRIIPLNPDSFFSASLAGGNGVFANNVGTLDSRGEATAHLTIPNWPWLVGFRFLAGAVVLDSSSSSSVRRIGGSITVVVQ